MNEITLQLPKTLYQNLSVLAKKEAVPLTQYILYILTRQIAEGYTVRVVPEEDVVSQKASFDSLLSKWGKIPFSEADRILERREPAELEADLSPEVVSSLKARIARSESNRM